MPITAMRTAMPKVTLIQNYRLRAVSHLRVDLHAAVHRAGVHHDGIGRGERESPALEVFLRRGQKRAAHALVLQAQLMMTSTPFSPSSRIDVHAHLIEIARQQRARTMAHTSGTPSVVSA